MPDPRERIQRMFDPPNRYGSYGDVLVRMHVKGFRCHTDTLLDIASPITAFCGLNGTGKSTLLQLAAAAYRDPQHAYYLKDFIVVGILDPAPCAPAATVEYRFWNNQRLTTPRTLSRKPNGGWSGYRRRFARPVFFAGIGQYLPRIEHRDFVITKAGALVVSGVNAVTDKVKEWTLKVLSCRYDQIMTNTVTYTTGGAVRTGQVVSVQRQNVAYSEAHMGFGEGRTQFLITVLENLPDRSLVLIEEPETSLHPSAQYQLGQYFLDVVQRKRHQIMLTTHSEYFLVALPPQSRIYLKRVGDHIEVSAGLSAWQIRSLLAEGQVKALDVLVEDECSAAILRAALRITDPIFLEVVQTHTSGAWQNIATTMEMLNTVQLPIAAVLDADQNPDPTKNVFCLPGAKLPPEKALFAEPAVKSHIHTTYGINLDDFSATVTHLDHHGWFERLAERINHDKASLLNEAARVYVQVHFAEAASLTEQLKSTLK